MLNLSHPSSIVILVESQQNRRSQKKNCSVGYPSEKLVLMPVKQLGRAQLNGKIVTLAGLLVT